MGVWCWGSSQESQERVLTLRLDIPHEKTWLLKELYIFLKSKYHSVQSCMFAIEVKRVFKLQMIELSVFHNGSHTGEAPSSESRGLFARHLFYAAVVEESPYCPGWLAGSLLPHKSLHAMYSACMRGPGLQAPHKETADQARRFSRRQRLGGSGRCGPPVGRHKGDVSRIN